jgi:hypothetical protein
MSAVGVDGFGNFFDVSSTATENATVGTLGAGPAETSVRTLAGAVVNFAGGTGGFAFRSTLTGNSVVYGGEGGGGAGLGLVGAEGEDGGVEFEGVIGGGAPGGSGGGGGGSGPFAGGDGGDGGYGGYLHGQAGGFYQGTVSVTVAQL